MAGPERTRSKIPEIDGRDYSELCPHFAESPHQKMDALRDQTPVAWDRTQKQYLSLEYATTRKLLQDGSWLRDRKCAKMGTAVSQTFEAAPDFVPERKNGASVVIFSDGDEHRRLRRFIGEPFLVRVKQARARVEALVTEVVGGLVAKGPDIDLVEDYAIPIPVTAIAALLGLPREDHVRVRQWSDDLALGFNPYRSADEDLRRWRAIRAMIDYFGERLRQASCTPGDDLISDFASARAAGEPLSEKEIVDHCIMMLTAGNLSTTDLIANASLTLLRDHALRERVLGDFTLISAVVEESLRLDPPVTTTDRIAPGEAVLGGADLGGGDVVTASLLSANHDPSVFPDAHRFDVDRPTRQHLAFGAGAHICLGAPLARLEAQAALTALFARFPAVKLVDEAVRIRAVPGHRGPEALHVRLW